MNKTRSVAVIGAGVGGICAATHLAKQGLHVTVFEKIRTLGGAAIGSSWKVITLTWVRH